MTLPYDPAVDWARDDEQEREVAELAAAYAANVDAYHAQVRTINAEHQATLRRAYASFNARNGQVVARLQQLLAERRVDATLAGYARHLRGE